MLLSLYYEIWSYLQYMYLLIICILLYGLDGWFSDNESTCNAGDAGDMDSTPGSGRSTGGGYGNPLQCSWTEETGGLHSIGS